MRERTFDEAAHMRHVARQIFAAIPGGVVVVFDADLRFLVAEGNGFVNRDWRSREVEGRTLADVQPAGAVRMLEPHFRAALEGEHRSFEFTGPGRGRIFSIQVFPLRAADGSVIAGCVLGHDATERHAELHALNVAEQRFAAGFHNSPTAMTLCDTDGRYLEVNDALCQLLERSRAELIGRSFAEFTHPDDVDQSARWLEGLRSGDRDAMIESKRYVSASGRVVEVVLSSAVVRDARGRPLHMFNHLIDVTDRKAAETALAATEADFRATFEQAPIGMSLVALDGRTLRVNRALMSILGHAEADFLACPLPNLVDWPAFADEPSLGEALRRKSTSVQQMEKRCYHKTGAVVWIAMSTSLVLDPEGSPSHFVVQIQDISERKRLEQELQRLADYDELTGLPNRRRFDAELARGQAQAERRGEPVAVIVLDLDNLKAVNDAYGHRVGDELLREVGKLLDARVRASDTCARIGGDEFAVLTYDGDHAGATVLAGALIDGLRDIRIPVGNGVEITPVASFGISFLRSGIAEIDVVAAADDAMYQAKRAGGDRYRIVEVVAVVDAS